ncbi:MAG: hypothetical protein QW369_05955 [Desulfurococcaceae archaeon]
MSKLSWKPLSSLALIVLVALSTLIATFNVVSAEGNDEAVDDYLTVHYLNDTYASRDLATLGNISFDQLLDLYYIVGNVTKPVTSWGIEHNSTIALNIVNRSEWFYSKALECLGSNDRMAKAMILLSTLTLTRSPAIAHEVMAKTLRRSLSEAGNVTLEAVNNVTELTNEFRELLTNALNYALGANASIPILVEALIAEGDYRLELSRNLTNLEKYGAALAMAVSGYNNYVRAYALLIRSLIAWFLREQLTVRFLWSIGLGLDKELQVGIRNRVMERLENWVSRGMVEKIGGRYRVRARVVSRNEVEQAIYNIIIGRLESTQRLAVELRNKFGHNWQRVIGESIRANIMQRLAHGEPLGDAVNSVLKELISSSEVQYQVVIVGKGK